TAATAWWCGCGCHGSAGPAWAWTTWSSPGTTRRARRPMRGPAPWWCWSTRTPAPRCGWTPRPGGRSSASRARRCASATEPPRSASPRPAGGAGSAEALRDGLARGRGLAAVDGVDQGVGGAVQVVPQRLRVQRREVERVHGIAHVAQPRVLGRGGDGEHGVAHPQPRMAALLAVGLRPAPVLLEEGAQAVLGPGEVLLGVHRPELGILGDPLVEAVHEAHEGLVTADGLVEGDLLGRGGAAHVGFSGWSGSLLHGLDEAGHREGDVGVREAGADPGAQLTFHAPLLAGRGLDGDAALVAVAVHVEDAGDRSRREDGVAPGGVLGDLGGDLLDHLGDQLVVGIGVDVEHDHG